MFTSMCISVYKIKPIIVTLSLLILLFGTDCKPSEHRALRIATAANAQYAMVDIVKAFTERTGIEAELVISSSGKLSIQIEQGAPYDIFISADMKYPLNLYRNGYAASKPRLYAYGEIAIWTIGDIEPTFNAMLRHDVHHVAIANPRTAPYGLIAMKALKNSGVLDSINGKLVYGENVGQVNQFIASGAAEIGITAKSMIMSPQMKDKGKWTQISGSLYSPISQGLIIIERKEGFRDDAMKFYDFMISDTARKILVENGYKLSEQ
jgi:molybdate transport system substrate-binding protein